MALGIWLRASGSGHMAPGLGRQAYGSGRTQEIVCAQRLVTHDLYVGDPKVPQPDAQRLCTAFGEREGASIGALDCHVL